ncbi:MAG: hypothetical protein AAGC77_03340 [Pseudomonadota bacterium]
MRTVIGVVVGMIVGVIVVAVVESLGHMIFPPPAAVDLNDPEALQTIMDEISVAAKAAVLVAWGLGVLIGGIVARRISRGAPLAAWSIAAFFLAFAAMTMTQIPHPLWMVVGAVVVTILGAIVANRVTSR